MKRVLIFGLFGILLFPSVNNFTPAHAVDQNIHSTDQADSLWVVVNKARPLNPLQYKPADLITVGSAGMNINPYGRKMRKDAAWAAVELAKAASSAGRGKLVIQSAYRSFTEQKAVHTRQVKRFGLTAGEALA